MLKFTVLVGIYVIFFFVLDEIVIYFFHSHIHSLYFLIYYSYIHKFVSFTELNSLRAHESQ